MRIALAEIAQETDSFSPLRTTLREFETYGLYFGDEILDRMRGAGPLGGFLEVAAEQPQPLDLVPLVRAWASAGGPIAEEAFVELRRQLVERLAAALPVDAVFLSLHGAASSENEDDVEGSLLAAVREVVGAHIPIVVPLDHHANITRRMTAHADLLVGHETQPHDPPATGRKAARLLFRMLRREIAPVMAWQKIPMITPQDQFLTSAGPMRDWFERARQLEREPGVLDVSPYPMQPWLDVEEGGWSVIAHTNGDQQLAVRIVREMAEQAWRLRREFWRSERMSPEAAVRRAVEAPEGLVILSDTGDSVYGGAPGDNTVLLRELLAQRVPCLSLVPIIDEEAVAEAFRAGVRSQVSLRVGGKGDRVFCQPVELEGAVAALSQGMETEIPGRGVCRLGRTALVKSGQVCVALLDHRSFAINHPILYAHLGIEVAEAKLVVVKTASNFQFFEKWRKELIRVDTPGTTQSNLSAFEWKRLPRPIDPFEEIDDWRPDPQLRTLDAPPAR